MGARSMHTFQLELDGRPVALGFDAALDVFVQLAIDHPFQPAHSALIAQVLETRDPNRAEIARSGVRVDALGRERFMARLRDVVDIGDLGADDGVRLTRFDALSEPFEYPASVSADPAPVGSLQASPAPLRTHHVAELEGARLCIGPFGQAVFDCRGRFVDGICQGDGVVLALTDPGRLPAPQSFDGTAVSLCSLWGNGYFHWLLEVLPKLLLIARAGYRFQDIGLFVVRQRNVQLLEFLEFLGIPGERVYDWQGAAHLLPRRLLAVSSLEHYDYRQNPTGILVEPWASRAMHARFSRPRAPGAHGRRIYIDRAHASLRRVLNNTDVKAALAPHGFEFLALERLNLAQKQALFADAEMVVGPAGAGFANLLFCHPGTQVLVFYQQGFETNSFWSLCNNNRLGHFHLVCAPPQDQPASVHTNTINDDFQIDIDALTRTLECMRARPP